MKKQKCKYVVILNFHKFRPNQYTDFEKRKIRNLKAALIEFNVEIDDDNLGQDVDDYHLYIESDLKLPQLQTLVLLALGDNRQEFVNWNVLKE